MRGCGKRHLHAESLAVCEQWAELPGQWRIEYSEEGRSAVAVLLSNKLVFYFILIFVFIEFLGHKPHTHAGMRNWLDVQAGPWM